MIGSLVLSVVFIWEMFPIRLSVAKGNKTLLDVFQNEKVMQ